MNKKQVVILSIILAILVVGVVFKQFKNRPELHSEETRSLSVNFDISKISKIEIKKGNGDITQLVSENGSWQIPSLWNAHADALKINELLNALRSLRGEERAHSKELFPDFGITDAEAVHLILYEKEKEVVHLLIGIKQANSNEIFIRKNENASTFISSASLLSNIGMRDNAEITGTSFWANLNLIPTDADHVVKIEFKENGGEWHEIGSHIPFEKDKEKMKNALEEMIAIKAVNVADPAEKKTGLDQPIWELKISLKEGDPLKIGVGGLKPESTAEERFVHTSTSNMVYLLPQATLARLKIDSSRFVISNPLHVEPGMVEKLTVHTEQEEITLEPKKETSPEIDSYLNQLALIYLTRVPELIETIEGPYWFELKSEGKEAIRIACEKPADEKIQDVKCSNLNNSTVFYINKYTFDSIFTQLQRFKSPPQTT